MRHGGFSFHLPFPWCTDTATVARVFQHLCHQSLVDHHPGHLQYFSNTGYISTMRLLVGNGFFPYPCLDTRLYTKVMLFFMYLYFFSPVQGKYFQSQFICKKMPGDFEKKCLGAHVDNYPSPEPLLYFLVDVIFVSVVFFSGSNRTNKGFKNLPKTLKASM